MADANEDNVLDTEIPTGEAEAPAEDLLNADPPPGDEDEEEVLVSFEGEGAPAQGEEQDSSVIRAIREENRKLKADLRAAKATQTPQTQVIEVGEKPTLAACEYDEERFEAELDAWKDRGAKAEEAKAQAQRTQAALQEAWTKELAETEAQRAKLNARDYDQAAENVREAFDEQQQAMIVRASLNKANMVYALGKNAAKRAELAKITDPVKFIAEVARLEGKLTVTTQRKAPPPEQIVRGSAPLAAPADKHEKTLEAEAAKSGNYTKLFEYRRSKRSKA